jgi:hypothetical protein
MSVKRIIPWAAVLLGLLVSAAGTASATKPLRNRPILSALHVTPGAIRLGAPGPPATVITFTLSRGASVRLSFAKTEVSAGATHFVNAGQSSLHGRPGKNSVLFNGAFPPGTALAPGTYTLTATPMAGMHGTGTPRTTRLIVLPA